MKHIGFKSYPEAFEQLLSGSRKWDARVDDSSDDRIYSLTNSHTRQAAFQEDIETVTFANKFDLSWQVTFRLERLEFSSWAPGWIFLIIGDRIETPEEVEFGEPLAIDIQDVISPGLAKRLVGRLLVPVAKKVLPFVVNRLPRSAAIRIRSVLPCVFAVGSRSHNLCFCVKCGGFPYTEMHLMSSQGVARVGGQGTHRYLKPSDCDHTISHLVQTPGGPAR